jgi:hypothetical protein
MFTDLPIFIDVKSVNLNHKSNYFYGFTTIKPRKCQFYSCQIGKNVKPVKVSSEAKKVSRKYCKFSKFIDLYNNFVPKFTAVKAKKSLTTNQALRRGCKSKILYRVLHFLLKTVKLTPPSNLYRQENFMTLSLL